MEVTNRVLKYAHYGPMARLVIQSNEAQMGPREFSKLKSLIQKVRKTGKTATSLPQLWSGNVREPQMRYKIGSSETGVF